MEYALIDSLKKVETLAVPKGNLMDNYLHHLSSNPERVDSILLLFFFTLVCWFVIWKYREKFLVGLAGDGGHPDKPEQPVNLDAREQLIFIYYFIPVPCIFYVLLFRNIQTYQFVAMCIAVAPGFYQIFGRFIFDWILALRSGQPIKSTEPEAKASTITTTTTQTK